MTLIHNLPAQPTPFVGRVDELAEIAKLLDDPACRLLTLVGPGGIGKTRLAVEAATRLEAYAHGVYFAALQPLQSPEFMVSAIADTVGFQFYPGGDPKQQLLEYLHEKSLLLVLDNFEHLLDGADLLPGILDAAPQVKIFVTSRELLHLREEWVFDLAGLTFPTDEFPGTLDDYSAARLFIQSARRYGYVSQSADAEAIVRICQITDGIPLAIEMAAALVRVMSCADICREIEHSLDILTTSVRNVPEKHRNMRAVFDHSWKLLSDEERAVFSKLSVFRGGFTREAAVHIAGASVTILSALVDKSMLRVDANRRYDLHELLRQYGEEQLDLSPGEGEAVRDLHSAYYADFMRQRQNHIYYTHEDGHQQDGLAKIGEEIENVRLTVWRTIRRGEFEGISQYWESIWFFLEVQNWFQEGEDICRAAIERLRSGFDGTESERNRLLGLCLGWHVWFLWRLFRLPEVQQATQDCLSLLYTFVGDNERTLVLEKLGASGVEYSVAKQLLEEAVVLGKAHGQLWWAASALQTLSQYTVSRGEYREAKRLAHESLSMCEAVNEEFVRFYVLLDLSNIAVAEGEYNKAGQYADEARGVSETFGYQWGVLRSSALQGNSALAERNYPLARQRYEECLALAENLGVRWFTGIAYLGLGSVAAEVGTYLEAQGYFLQALRITDGSVILPHFEDLMPRILNRIAALWAKAGKREAAAELITVVLNQPATSGGIKDDAERVGAQLKIELGAEVYAAAQERGRGLDLDTLVAQVMNTLENAPPIADRQTSNAAFKANQALTEPLSEREIEVLQLIANGLSNTEIAQQLFVGVSTVKKHINHIFGKLGVETRSDALVRAQELHLI